MKVTTATVQQTANEVLGAAAKTLYYLVIENDKKEKHIINIGEKTHNKIQELIKQETPAKQKEPAK
jgi:hypothetical protein